MKKFFTRNKQNLDQKYYYNKHFWYKFWKFDDTHFLQIDIYNPPISKAEYKTFLAQEYGTLEEYLSIFNTSAATSKTIYNSLIEFIGFAAEEILDNEKIVFSLIENINGQELVLRKVKLFKGEIQEYTVLENGERYAVSRNGDWSYLSNTIFIKYIDAIKNYSYSMTGEENDFTNSKLIERVKVKISELQKFVQ